MDRADERRGALSVYSECFDVILAPFKMKKEQSTAKRILLDLLLMNTYYDITYPCSNDVAVQFLSQYLEKLPTGPSIASPEDPN